MDIFVIKLSLTPLSMLAVSLAARRWGSFVGGLLAGMPLTSGPISIYLALEQGPAFAARAADGALSGTGAVLVSYACYAALSRRPGRPVTCVLSFLAFVACAVLVLAMDRIAVAILVSLMAIGVMAHLTRAIRGADVGDRRPAWDLPARLAASTAMVLAITAFASRLGPTLSGILSPIPVISWPLIVFAHVQGGRPDALAAVRGTAAGALGILVFYMVVAHFVANHGLLVVYGSALAAAAFVSALSAIGLNVHAARSTPRRRAPREARPLAKLRASVAIALAMVPVLITGVAGFIGNALALRYLSEGTPVVGLDNLNDYYDPALKQARLARIATDSNFTFAELDLIDQAGLDALFATHGFEIVVNMAAQAGVRYSLVNPRAYVKSNLDGFLNVLEACRHNNVRHLLYASSSSVYGAVTAMPFSIHQNVDHPVSLYAATKKANELMAHSYSHLYALPTTGLRFFTVYGPWGRPDMALSIFAEAMLAGRPIQLFNHGAMRRDFTYIDDVVEAVRRLADRVAVPNPEWDGAAPDPGSSLAPYRIYNIGNNQPETLARIVECLERYLSVTAIKTLMPMQPGDVVATYADVTDLAREIDFSPTTSIEDGIARFAAWYSDYSGAKRD